MSHAGVHDGNGGKTLELAKTAHLRYLEQSFQGTPTTGRNATIEQPVRSRLCPTYSKPFDVFAEAVETGDWPVWTGLVPADALEARRAPENVNPGGP